MKQITVTIIVLLICALGNSFEMLAQPVLITIEGDTWIQDTLRIGDQDQYLLNPTGFDLGFYTKNKERMRIEGSGGGGLVKIFVMDTINSQQNLTTGNVVRLADGTLAIRQHAIGDTVHGGIVFWVDETGEHGLVCSLTDLESSPGDSTHQWYQLNTGSTTGARGDGIGAGSLNTKLITTFDRGDEDAAARLCLDLQDGGFAEWYLPSLKELELMCMNLHYEGLGGFVNQKYWSSTEFNTFNAWIWDFDEAKKDQNQKEVEMRVRAVRSF